MDDGLLAQLPVYRRIEADIRELIATEGLAAHARLPSESELAIRHEASVGTVRKALGNLVEAKVIYRRHGRGSFVAPRVRKGRVLIVPGSWELDETIRSDYTDFFFGALVEANRADLACEPALVDREDFVENREDAKMVYPELAGVIFVRGHGTLQQCRDALVRQRLPFLFYGPDIYPEDADAPYATIHHDEWRTTELLAGHFVRRGLNRVAVIRPDSDIGRERDIRLSRHLDRRGLAHESFPATIIDDHEALRGMVGRFDVVACMTSHIAIGAVQTLERDLGLCVPRDVAVCGVDDMPAADLLRPGLTAVDLCNAENGRLAIRMFCEFVARGGREPFHAAGHLRLVERESC